MAVGAEDVALLYLSEQALFTTRTWLRDVEFLLRGIAVVKLEYDRVVLSTIHATTFALDVPLQLDVAAACLLVRLHDLRTTNTAASVPVVAITLALVLEHALLFSDVLSHIEVLGGRRYGLPPPRLSDSARSRNQLHP
jgi:hypothetical protein